MPDDLTARNAEGLRRPLDAATDLGRKLDKLSTQLDKLGKRLDRIEALGQRVTTYIDENRAVGRKQFAQTALVDARAEHDRRFGHHQMVRRSVTGMLQAMTTGVVRPAVLLRTAEQLMIDDPGYWLSPAQVALAALACDNPVSAKRAVLEAVSRDPGRSALFFSLVLGRFGRHDAAARWIAEYARAQDHNALTGDFTTVLDAVARGALGGPARERLLDTCRGWRDQIGQSGQQEAKQVTSWRRFIRRQRRPLTDTFHPLGMVSRDWAAKLDRLETAAAFGYTEQWLEGRLGGTGESDETLPATVDDLLRELIAAPDQAECALLEAVGRWQAIIERDGYPPAPASDDPGEPARTDFLTLSTAIATGTYQSDLSEQAARFCLLLSRTSVQRAVADLSQQVKSTYPASIGVDIRGWHHAIEPGDDPDALVQEFLEWAHDAMNEDKAQATRKRLGISKPSARLERIESTWKARKQEGQETVYQAARQANDFYAKWQKGIAAAGECVELLRDQSAWGDTREPRTGHGTARPAMRLPAWDLEPPDPG